MIKAILFDMDGVLIDAKEWHYTALNRALGLFGFEISRVDHIHSYDGLPTKDKLNLISETSNLPYELHDFINQVKQKYTNEIINQKCAPLFVHEYALKRLRDEKYKLVVCSNSIRNTVEIMMDKAELSKYLDFVMSNEDVKRAKPDPEIYRIAMKKLGINPYECLILEDNKNGIIAAKKSGGHLMKIDTVYDVNYENIKNRININIKDYKEYSEIYSSIEIEIKPVKNKYGKFINMNENEIYYHIYFNDNKEEIKRNYLNENDNVSKIKIIIDYQFKSFEKLFYYCECIQSIYFKKFSRNNISDMSFIHEILKAFEYYKNKSIFVDIIIINNESTQYAKVIKKEIDDELYRIYTLNSFYHTPGSVTVINSSNITQEDKSLLNMVPRLRFIVENHISLKEAVEELQKNNTVNDYPEYLIEENLANTNIEKLKYDNGYGGFKSHGKEYVIYNKNTPTPWSNVIANKSFGTIITNNGCGYTYAYNSGEFKISSWTNEMVINDKSEGFKFNERIFDPEKCTHGFGYSVLESETKDLKHEITEFVAKEDTAKIYLIKLTNKKKESYPLKVEFWINPTFGNFEEKTTRHILTEFMGDDNYLKMRNVYSINYGDVNVFMSASEKIEYAECNRMLTKNISFTIELEPNEDKWISFVLGCSMSDSQNKELISKYTNLQNAKKELKNVVPLQ